MRFVKVSALFTITVTVSNQPIWKMYIKYFKSIWKILQILVNIIFFT